MAAIGNGTMLCLQAWAKSQSIDDLAGRLWLSDG
jgi:hypothetical protein